MTKPDSIHLGYMASYASANGVYYGGILVVNGRGLPREFRHTSGVRPSRLQETLYGDSLLSCLGTDSLGPALWDALHTRPTLLLLDEISKPVFGDYALRHVPVALIKTAGSSEAMFMDSVSPLGYSHHAVELRHHGVVNSLVFAYVEDDEFHTGLQVLEAAQNTMNLSSPFLRIRSVLAQVSEIEDRKARK